MDTKASSPIAKSGPRSAKQAAIRPHGLPAGYAEFLNALKARIHAAQVKATLSANRELIELYWDTGRRIVERQEQAGWGAGVIRRLAKDIAKGFPGMRGFSESNIWRMRAFFIAYAPAPAKLAQPVRVLMPPPLPRIAAALPWSHNLVLMEKLKDRTERLWYAEQTVIHGWSRPILVHQIESGLFERQGGAVTNFKATLPPPQSDLARQVLKDPYALDFLPLAARAREKDLQRGLIERLRAFLLELGTGFAFVGSQYHLEIGGQDYYLDLLFYHLRLRCYIVIELKADDFRPEFAGKMNFYLSAVDDLLRHPHDNPSVGLILCKTRNRVVAEYSLRDSRKPIGVSAYKLTRSLPEKLKTSLPAIGDLEAELGPGK